MLCVLEYMGREGGLISYFLPRDKNRLSPFLKQLFRGIDFNQDSVSLAEEISKRLENSRTVGFITAIWEEGCILTMPIEADFTSDGLYSIQFEEKEKEKKVLSGVICVSFPLPETTFPELSVYAIMDNWTGKTYFRTDFLPSFYAKYKTSMSPPYLLEVPEGSLQKLPNNCPYKLGGILEWKYQIPPFNSWAFKYHHIDMKERWKIYESLLLPPFENCQFEANADVADSIAEIISKPAGWQLFRVVKFAYVRPVVTKQDFNYLKQAQSELKKALTNPSMLEAELFRYLDEKAKSFHAAEELVSTVWVRLITRYRYPKHPTAFGNYVVKTFVGEKKNLYMQEEKYQDSYYTPVQAAQKIGCSSDWIYKLIREGKIKPIVQGRYLFSWQEVAKLQELRDSSLLRQEIVKILILTGIGERAARKWIKRRMDKGIPVGEIVTLAIRSGGFSLGLKVTNGVQELLTRLREKRFQ